MPGAPAAPSPLNNFWDSRSQVKPGGGDKSFVRPPAKNLGDVLGWQQAAVLENAFHRHSQDANMKALRQSLGIEKFYEQDASSAGHIFGPVIDKVLDHMGRGVIDTTLATFTDPLTVETLGAGKLAQGTIGLTRPLWGPVGSAAAKSAIKVLPGTVRDAIADGRTVANAMGRLWHHLTQYAPKAKEAVGVSKTRQAIGAGSRSLRREAELNRRLQDAYKAATSKLSVDDKSFVQRALNGQVPLDRLTPAQRYAHNMLRNMTDIAGPVLQHKPGGGSIAAVSRFGVDRTVAPGTARGSVTVEPRLSSMSPQMMRRQLFTQLKQKGVSVADRNVAFKQILGKTSLLKASQDDLAALYKHFNIPVVPPKGKLLNRGYQVAQPGRKTLTGLTANSSMQDWIAGLKGEDLYREAHGKQLGDLPGAILKNPNYVQGPFGKLQRAPIVAPNRTLKGSAFTMTTPEVPKELQEFTGTPGEFTASNVRSPYHPGRMYKEVVAKDRPAKTVNPLEAHNPHLISQKPFRIKPSEVDDFEKAFQGMLKTTAWHVSNNDLKVRLGEIFGVKPSEVEKSLPREVFDMFTKHVPAKGKEREWQQVLKDTWKGIVNLPKVAVVGAGPFHMFNILKMMGVQDPDAVPEALVNFGKILRAGNNPAKRWQYLNKEAADYGLGTPLEDMKGWTAHIPGLKTMNQLTWDWDTASALALAKRSVRSGKVTHPLEAGQDARERLVDYDHRSKAQEAARYVAPFSQYATASPGVILGGVKKAPLAAETVNRATGGKFLGGGDRQTGEDYGPSAKVGRMVNIDAMLHPGADGNRFPGVTSYVRGATTEPLRILESLAGIKGATYGKDPLSPEYLKEAAVGMSPVPFARNIFETTGMGAFQKTDPWSEAIFSATGYLRGQEQGAKSIMGPKTPQPQANPKDPLQNFWNKP